ncbi:MAG: hypothetical protein EBX37_13265 [Alphaproteobacteria bacterium]|nr:hypothetical protein [Alphaproteobacteria bacterium]
MTAETQAEQEAWVKWQVLRENILTASNYDGDWGLGDGEVGDILRQCEEALRTTNGDTGPVTVTARQMLLLLRTYVLSNE